MGHKTSRWNPKMKPYIFKSVRGIHIIDLEQTKAQIESAQDLCRLIASRGGTVLFVGTKTPCRDAIRKQARRCGMPYVSRRWLGGLLTNWRTMAGRVEQLHALRVQETTGQLDLLPVRERMTRRRELRKLEANLGGVAELRRLPDAIFIVDPGKESIGIREANHLRIPVIALVDTNCDPDGVTLIIPGNDDGIEACNVVVTALADAISDASGANFEQRSNLTVKATHRPRRESWMLSDRTPDVDGSRGARQKNNRNLSNLGMSPRRDRPPLIASAQRQRAQTRAYELTLNIAGALESAIEHADPERAFLLVRVSGEGLDVEPPLQAVKAEGDVHGLQATVTVYPRGRESVGRPFVTVHSGMDFATLYAANISVPGDLLEGGRPIDA